MQVLLGTLEKLGSDSIREAEIPAEFPRPAAKSTRCGIDSSLEKAENVKRDGKEFILGVIPVRYNSRLREASSGYLQETPVQRVYKW